MVKNITENQAKMPIHFRNYIESDLSQVRLLMEELGYPVPIEELMRNIAEIKNRGGQIIIAQEHDTVIGSVCVIIDVRLAEGIYAEIVSLVVNSEARGKGIGKALVKQAEQWAITHVKKIRVRANAVRKEAHSFYETLGYNCIKQQKVFRKTL
ncbi:MAG: GNAT family N-acetyltransferase [Desulfobacterales bacterium]|nr:GNAT family N-acetyltransferase [Desulfobacterales bacterium]